MKYTKALARDRADHFGRILADREFPVYLCLYRKFTVLLIGYATRLQFQIRVYLLDTVRLRQDWFYRFSFTFKSERNSSSGDI